MQGHRRAVNVQLAHYGRRLILELRSEGVLLAALAQSQKADQDILFRILQQGAFDGVDTNDG